MLTSAPYTSWAANIDLTSEFKEAYYLLASAVGC